MGNDTAIVLLLADMQRQIEALRTENAALREQAARVRETPHGPVTETPA